MLQRFLKAIKAGDVQSLTDIARKLNVSPDMVLIMAQELTRKGYLQEIGSDCGEPQQGCSDCPANKGCQVNTRHWFLTEKGKNAAANIPT